MRNHEQALADYIERAVDSAPPLTREQRDRLSVLLNSTQPKFEVSRPIAVRIQR